MKNEILKILEASGSLTFNQIIVYIIMSAVISIVIYLSYYVTHEGSIYSKKFNVSLMMMTVLTATVMTVIGNNVALSLGMVGALSIVRFRTAIKDSRDTAYIFWAIIVGICCGVGDYIVASVGSAIVFCIMFLLGRVKDEGRYLLVIRAAKNAENDIEGLVFDYYNQKANLRVKNTTKDSVELIYELSKRNMKKAIKKEKNITNALYEIKNVEYVNLISQNDEISG